ncbi:hypothetical protein [Dactylosporangium matsuzakiense]|uniref:Uncharacterized protein n=1 Tax=Dactylosporangium matsuzakiense TaxID=53360 RepID=A0A9W6NLT9_9ACTN|nr:hypothetical protein [Dactylosporangium matsuzakiense]UWZ46748.1 hypothetical protein Dmats_10185 [Dactylosporangium matsuzakiense]GLL01709.1 hypothetical protein GCM10017581_034510 [Dactylosporangium matsuzakiense]
MDDTLVRQPMWHAWRLQGRVEAACGRSDKFGQIEQQFVAWLQDGAYASPAVATSVEPYLAGYLQGAAVAGRRWGRTMGLIIGLVLGVVAGILAGVLT